MIVVDTSALMAILLGEPEGEAIMRAIEAATLPSRAACPPPPCGEGLGVGTELRYRVEGLGIEVVGVTAPGAEAVAAAYQRWGKGIHPAGLNFGDCFAYALARERACPLLFVGDDFSRTGVTSALAPGGR